MAYFTAVFVLFLGSAGVYFVTRKWVTVEQLVLAAAGVVMPFLSLFFLVFSWGRAAAMPHTMLNAWGFAKAAFLLYFLFFSVSELWVWEFFKKPVVANFRKFRYAIFVQIAWIAFVVVGLPEFLWPGWQKEFISVVIFPALFLAFLGCVLLAATFFSNFSLSVAGKDKEE